MMHLILIDIDSGYIWADTRNLRGYVASEYDFPCGDETAAIKAAELIDRENLAPCDHYEFMTVPPNCGYCVYRVDIDGSEAVTVVADGQDQEQIDAVERDCEFIGYVKAS